MREGSFFKTKPFLMLAAYILFLVLLCTMLFSVDAIRLPIILAVIFYFSLCPLANSLERKGLSRGLSIVAIYTSLGLIFFALFWLLFPLVINSYKKMLNEYPHMISQLKNTGEVLFNRFDKHIPETLRADTLQQVFIYLQNTMLKLLKSIPAMIPDFITTFLLVPVFGFFLIRDGTVIQKQLLVPVPNRYFEISLKLLNMINKKVGAYIRGRLLESFIVGLLVGIGLFFIDIEYSFFHGILAAVLNLIPFIGPVIAAIPAIVLSFVDFQGWWQIVAVICVFTGVQVLDATIFVSTVLAKAIDLHPVWVISAIFAGGQIYGVVGMVIGVPIVSILKIILEESIREGAALK